MTPLRLATGLGLLSLLLLGATSAREMAPRIVEGPMVQLPSPGEVSVVWFANRPGKMSLHLEGDGPKGKTVDVDSGDRKRFRAVLAALLPDREYRYRITGGNRELFRGRFRTMRSAGRPFQFVVFGDSGTGGAAQRDIADRVRQWEPDFLLHTGDLVYEDGDRAEYKRKFFDPYRLLLSRIPIWPAIGNHDVRGPGFGAAFRDVFDVPKNSPSASGTEENYWFDYGNARIAVVNTEHRREELKNVISPWLLQVFDAPSVRWKFVALHRPPYASIAKPRGGMRVRVGLVPTLEKAGVDIVFGGHQHIYERTHAIRGGELAQEGKGVVYVISGAGGGKLHSILEPGKRAEWSAAGNSRDHGFTFVTIDGPALRLRQITRDGRTIDDWSMTR